MRVSDKCSRRALLLRVGMVTPALPGLEGDKCTDVGNRELQLRLTNTKYCSLVLSNHSWVSYTPEKFYFK